MWLAKLLSGSGESRLSGVQTGPMFGGEAALFSQPLTALTGDSTVRCATE